MNINQSKEDFRKWLRSQPGSEFAIAGDPSHCWLAQWFESQGFFVWGVFPQHYLERSSDAPAGASQEILLEEPDEEGEVADSNRIKLEDWACGFGKEIDLRYPEASAVSRNQALSVLAE